MRRTEDRRRRAAAALRIGSSTVLSAALLAVGAPALAATVIAAPPACRIVSPDYTVAVVELYTSQGCSSCPPADRWLSSLPAGTPRLRAIPLAFHIGYWDTIGWKDPFARKEFNERQYQLAAFNRSRGVYTPEVFVGASELSDWNRPEAFARSLAGINERAPLARIELQAQWLAPAAGSRAPDQRLSVEVHWTADASARDPQLLLAVKRNGYVTHVEAGENGGSMLHNDHVVRTWAGPFKAAAKPLTAELSVAAAQGDASLVAIAQDGITGAVLQAVELPLSACAASATVAAR
jgi:hypothetical protein